MIAQPLHLKRTGPLAPPAVGPGQRPLVQSRGGHIDYYERIVLPPRSAAGGPDPTQRPQPIPPQPAIPQPAPPQDRGDTSERNNTGTGHRPAARITGLALLLAALQLVVGYQWLVSGVDKLLDGTFPDQLGLLITSAATGGHLPDFFAQLLQQVVLPNSYVVGWLVQVGETLTGAGLLAGALFVLVGPSLRARLTSVVGRLLSAAGALTFVAALASLAMALNYYLLDGLPTPWFQPGYAVGGAIDPSLLLALFTSVILLGRILAGWRRSRADIPDESPSTSASALRHSPRRASQPAA
ncbi:MAG TPA: hypothetical protein VF120_10530 [Ktedonobacterales bacterium]